MQRSVGDLVAWYRSPLGRKLVRYGMVSVVAVVCSQVILLFTFGVLHWTARAANITAVAVSAVPSYVLNRAWVWGKRDRSDFLREVVPFWVMAFLGLVISTWAADFAATQAAGLSRSWQTLVVMAASLAAFGVLWVGKFVVLHKVLFAPKGEIAAVESR